MFTKAFHPGLGVTCNVSAQTVEEFQINYKGRLTWVSRCDWQGI